VLLFYLPYYYQRANLVLNVPVSILGSKNIHVKMNYNRRHGLGTRSFVKSIPGPTAERLADRAVQHQASRVRVERARAGGPDGQDLAARRLRFRKIDGRQTGAYPTNIRLQIFV
jgi:hypothetical protein